MKFIYYDNALGGNVTSDPPPFLLLIESSDHPFDKTTQERDGAIKIIYYKYLNESSSH